MSVWIFSFLIAFNLVSSIAQFCRLQEKKYQANFANLCFNIWSAADQANLSLWYSAHVAKKSLSPGDYLVTRSQAWINMSRIATVWMAFAYVQLFTSITLSPWRLRYKIAVIAVYGYGVWDTFIPLVLGNPLRSAVRAFTDGSPQFLLFPSLAILYLGLSLFFKRSLPKLDSTGTPLSLAGIASQIAVHGIVAMSWVLMVGPSLIRNWRRLDFLYWPTFVMLWNRFLWPVVDNGIFAVLQGKLLWGAIRGRKVTLKEGRHKLQAVDEDESEEGEKEVTLPLTV